MDDAVRLILLVIAAVAGACTFALIHALVRMRWLRGATGSAKAASADGPRITWKERGPLILIVCALAALCLPSLTRGLEYDELEAASRFIVGVPLWTAASTVRAFNNHVAYSLLANLSVRLLGPEEWAIRLPAFLLGLAAVYALWQFARTWSTAQTALLSAALLALSPFFVQWTRSARGYTGLALMVLISTHNFFLALREGSPSLGIRHTVATVLAVYFHLYGAWAALLQYVVFLYAAFALQRRRETQGASAESLGLHVIWRSFVAIPLIVVVLYLPLASPLAWQLVQRAVASGPTPIDGNLALNLLEAFAGIDTPLLAAAACLLAVPGIACLRKHGLMDGYIVALIVVPFLTMSFLVRPFDLYARFFAYWTPMFAFLVASGTTATWPWALTLSRPRTRVMGLFAATALALATTFLAVSWLRTDLRQAPEAGYRDALLHLRDSPLPSATLAGDADRLHYYLAGPQRELHSMAELDRFMASAPTVLVAHLQQIWNTDDERQMAAQLRARCETEDRGPIVFFRCKR